ncbi:MAG: hypothetical protein L6R40_008771 [Gallowayella cf. fulva]|nr:MAG: hypothetical protein L6R40_008771 [Xanthomendoza cf. fulva]
MAKAPATDVEVIVDEGERVALSSGTEVLIQPLKARQFFKLLRIITHGAGGMLLNVQFSPGDTPEEFGAKLLALVGFAIPDAEDEVIDFLLAMVLPVGLKDGRTLSKTEKATNEDMKAALFEELYNPELEDLVTLIEAIVKREASDLQALGKRLMAMFELAKKTGQVPAAMTNSSE